jgi:hypothetical protein
MFKKTQNQKREANFYVNSMNRKAATSGDKSTERDGLRKNLNVDRFEDSKEEGFVRTKWERMNAEFTPEMALQKMDNVKQKGKTFDALAKCLKIARRIINGDNVPKRDDKFLFENYPGMHMRAWLLRRQNDDPKDYESVLDDKADGGKRRGSMQNSPVSSVPLSRPSTTQVSVETAIASLDVSV